MSEAKKESMVETYPWLKDAPGLTDWLKDRQAGPPMLVYKGLRGWAAEVALSGGQTLRFEGYKTQEELLEATLHAQVAIEGHAK